jgi:hypothetical protein
MIGPQFQSNVTARAECPIASAEEIIVRYEGLSVADHPFFVGLRSRPVDLPAIWLLMANLREGISGHFVRWLARTIESVGDLRIACFIAKQLNDELGDGDPRRVHSVLLDRFIEGLGPWRIAADDETILRPGRMLAESGARPFYSGECEEALGALIVGEIFAKKMDHCLGDEVRRQSLIDAESLTWLHIHEVLEVDHADEVAELAKLLPTAPPSLGSAWRGATRQWDALWTFLHELEQVRKARVARA